MRRGPRVYYGNRHKDEPIYFYKKTGRVEPIFKIFGWIDNDTFTSLATTYREKNAQIITKVLNENRGFYKL